MASAPFAWILRTLIADKIKEMEGNEQDIDGYLDAEKAKLIFHSTRGKSTLYLMAALGLTNGVEPPYANLVNIEVYSKADSDYGDGEYDGYLFRIILMGKFLPFPGCEKQYDLDSDTSMLCDLKVLMDRLGELAVPLNEWEDQCAAVTNAYFDEKKKKKKNKKSEDLADMEQVDVSKQRQISETGLDGVGIWSFAVGILFGAGIMWVIDRVRYFKNIFNDEYDVVS